MQVQPDLFVRQWDIIRLYVLSGALPDEHVRMLMLAGKTEKDVQAAEQRHHAALESTIAWVTKIGVIDPFVNDSIQHSLEVLQYLLKVLICVEYGPQGSRAMEVD